MKETVFFTLLICNFKYPLTSEWLWGSIQSERFCSTSHHLYPSSPPCLTPLLSVSPHLFTFFQFFLFPSLPSSILHLSFPQSLLLNVNLSVLHSQLYPPCSQPYPPLFILLSLISPFYSVSPSFNLSCLIFHSWLNTFSSPSSVFLPLPNLSSFISIVHSFTVGYIFLPFSFFSSASPPNLSILISIFLLFTVETSALTRETALDSNKQWGCRARWSAMASP